MYLIALMRDKTTILKNTANDNQIKNNRYKTINLRCLFYM